jgi:hypothetical protein
LLLRKRERKEGARGRIENGKKEKEYKDKTKK